MTYFYICMLEMWVNLFAVLKFGQVWHNKRQFYGTHSLFTDEIAPTILRNFGVGMDFFFRFYCAEKPIETLLNPYPKDSNLAMSGATSHHYPTLAAVPLRKRYQVSLVFDYFSTRGCFDMSC